MSFEVTSFHKQPIADFPSPPLSLLWVYSLAKIAYLTYNDHLYLGFLAAYSKTTDAGESSVGRHAEDLDFQRIRKYSASMTSCSFF